MLQFKVTDICDTELSMCINTLTNLGDRATVSLVRDPFLLDG